MSTQLGALQRWMSEVITHPDGVVAGANTDTAQAQFDISPEWFEEVVKPSPTMTSQQRMEIYHHGYFRRLLDCLAQLMPALRHALGDELFEQFGIEYLRSNPSRSHTLAQLDEGFVQFLSDNRPDRDLPQHQQEDWPDFMIELASFERSIRTTFDGPGAEGEPLLEPGTIRSWSDEQLSQRVLHPVPCLSLASYRFPVRTYLLAVRSGEDPAPPAPQRSWVAFNRRDFCVRLLDLERSSFDFLLALSTGEPVSTAAALAEAGGLQADDMRSTLCRLAEAGLFLVNDNINNDSSEAPGVPHQGAHR